MTSIALPQPLGMAQSHGRETTLAPTKYLFQRHRDSADDLREVTAVFPAGFSASKRELLTAVVQRLNELLRLQPCWDGENAAEISTVSALTAVQWLDIIADGETVMPQLIPLRTGGVQLEWLADNNALEMEFGPSGDVGVLGTDAAGNVIVEGEHPDANQIGFVEDGRKFLGWLSNAVRTHRNTI